jgi:hypothetical protein
MTEARTVRCDGCGGSIPIASLAPHVTCPYCRRGQAIPPHVLQELGAYQASVAGKMQQAASDRQQVGHWAVWTASPSTRQSFGAKYLLVIAPAYLICLGGVLLGAVLPKELSGIVDVLLVPTIVSTYAFGIGGYLLWYYRFRKGAASGRPLAGKTVACPSCGAPNVFAPGEVLDRCRYCRAALMPSHTVMREAVQVARQAAVQARMERLRRERTGATHYQRFHMPNAVPYIMWGGVFIACGFTAVSSTSDVITGKTPFGPGILVLWAVVLGVPAIIFAIIAWRKDKRRRWRESLATLAQQFGGQQVLGVPGTTQWLNTYWAAPYDLSYLFAGPYYDGVMMSALGFPALLVVDPTEANDLPPKVMILVAAWLPGIAEIPLGPGAWRPHGSEPIQEWLNGLGFHVQAFDAGLVARAAAETIDSLHDRPEMAAGLAPIIMAVARLAQGGGGTPVQPVP